MLRMVAGSGRDWLVFGSAERPPGAFSKRLSEPGRVPSGGGPLGLGSGSVPGKGLGLRGGSRPGENLGAMPPLGSSWLSGGGCCEVGGGGVPLSNIFGFCPRGRASLGIPTSMWVETGAFLGGAWFVRRHLSRSLIGAVQVILQVVDAVFQIAVLPLQSGDLRIGAASCRDQAREAPKGNLPGLHRG